jgi:hypothetical protein
MNMTHCMIPVVQSPRDYQAFRISPQDTNRLAIVFEPATAHASLTFCVEIFDKGGKTPPESPSIRDRNVFCSQRRRTSYL